MQKSIDSRKANIFSELPSAKQNTLLPITVMPPSCISTEEVEKHFGTTAVEKGFISFDQLMESLEIQEREYMEGKK